MTTVEFKAWPKIPRDNKETVTITEKMECCKMNIETYSTQELIETIDKVNGKLGKRLNSYAFITLEFSYCNETREANFLGVLIWSDNWPAVEDLEQHLIGEVRSILKELQDINL